MQPFLKIEDPGEVDTAVAAALAEDVGSGDVTTLAMVPNDAAAQAQMVAREELVVAGLLFAERAFRQLDGELKLTRRREDGMRVTRGEVLLEIEGKARPILTGERVALNFVQRLSGIATLTAQMVSAVAGTGARILDTRKTTPGWRRWEKYAVRCGGGDNHRSGLYDQALVKDNHLVALRSAGGNAIQTAVSRIRQSFPGLVVEVEADTLEQAEQAAAAGADWILLDNMTPERLREAVARIGGRASTEASGGIRLETVRAIAASGVQAVSIGALTHSARAVDIGLDFEIG